MESHRGAGAHKRPMAPSPQPTDADELEAELSHLRQSAVAAASSAAASWLLLTTNAIALHTADVGEAPHQRSSTRQAVIENITQSDQNCRDLLRLSRSAYHVLRHTLERTKKVKLFSHIGIDEQLVTFLLVVAHNFKNRVVSFFLCRSGETVSRYFHNMLAAIITLEEEFVRMPQGNEIDRRILNSRRFFPYFKDCLGAIDGTHVRVKVPAIDAPRYRGRKEWPTQNVLAACSFDLKFSYILAGWEGSAADSRVLQSALARDEPFVIPEGKFYLGDAGFGLTSKVLTPYARTRYHLKEYSQRPPTTKEELFNHRHSSLRNAIERAFGILKKRFPIIASGAECHYSCATMTHIILACCVLHNFLLDEDNCESSDVAEQCASTDTPHMESSTLPPARVPANGALEYRIGEELRERIAEDMWEDYCRSNESWLMDSPSKRFPAVSDAAGRESPRNFRWIQEYEDTLLELLLREARIGNRPDSSFTATAFRNVVVDFNNIHGTSIAKKHVQSRIKTMKAHFVLFHSAFHGLSGFAWNPVTKEFEADDYLWDQRIEENPRLAKYRHKSCHNWDKLFELYGGKRANGEGASGLKEKSLRIQRGLDFADGANTPEMMSQNNAYAFESSSYGSPEGPTSAAAANLPNSCSDSQTSAGSSGSKRKRQSTMKSIMEEGYRTVASSIEKLSMAFDRQTEKIVDSKFNVEQNTIIYEVVESLGLEDDYKMRCFCYLCGKPAKAALLVAAPAVARAKLLAEIMASVGDN